MCTWAMEAAEKFFQQERMEADRWVCVEQRRDSLFAEGAGLWGKTCEALQAQMAAFNECVGKEVMVATSGYQKFTVHAGTESNARALSVAFDSSGCSIVCSACGPDGMVDFQRRYVIELNLDDEVLIRTLEGDAINPDDIAAHTLNALMGWR